MWPVLGALSQRDFLSRYWQRKPLLLKKALVPFPDLITPEELAGLACDERVESRLIIEQGGVTPWELRRGPFKPSVFKKLPQKNWTFLVNGVDRFVPAVHGLLDHFSFLPFWRIDDVMISYAVEGGNVGAHVDNFDVFLIQAHGKREWMVEDRAVMHDDFIPDLPIRLLKKFKPTSRWVLEPGDILYLPPRFPHHGIAHGGDCMTISVGFRAPSLHEVCSGVVSAAFEGVDESVRFTDAGLKPQAAGEISKDAVASIVAELKRRVLDPDRVAEWLGRFSTEVYNDVDLQATARPTKPNQVAKIVRGARRLVRAEGARLAYVRRREGLVFFVNGAHHQVGGSAAELACALADAISVPADVVQGFLGDAQSRALLASLMSAGVVVAEA